MFLYHNMVIEESGDLARALDHLESIKPKIIDRNGWRVTKGT